jgi:hypothetical protein
MCRFADVLVSYLTFYVLSSYTEKTFPSKGPCGLSTVMLSIFRSLSPQRMSIPCFQNFFSECFVSGFKEEIFALQFKHGSRPG